MSYSSEDRKIVNVKYEKRWIPLCCIVIYQWITELDDVKLGFNDKYIIVYEKTNLCGDGLSVIL